MFANNVRIDWIYRTATVVSIEHARFGPVDEGNTRPFGQYTFRFSDGRWVTIETEEAVGAVEAARPGFPVDGCDRAWADTSGWALAVTLTDVVTATNPDVAAAVRCTTMTRGSWVIAAVAAGVAAVLLAGGWFLLDRPETGAAGATTPEVAPTTVLSFPADPSNGSTPPSPYPTVPTERVRGEHMSSQIRTGSGGRQLLVQVTELDCYGEEVRLLGEHADRVEVEIRMVAKPPPPGVSIGPDGSFGCAGYGSDDSPYAVIELREPLGDRAVVIDRSN